MTRPAPARVALLAVLGLWLLAPARVQAHGLEPALLSLREVAAGRFEVVWKSSTLRLPGAEVRPLLPATCRWTADPPQALDEGDRVRLRWLVECGADGLDGQAIGVADLDVAKIDALLRVERLDGSGVQTILTARQPTWTAPADPTRRQLLRHYARLGAAHLLGGLDRLLFVAGLLLLLAPAPRRLLQAVAAFAIGHSLTLVLVASGYLAVPARPVAILLAAGLLLLAVELTRDTAARSRLQRLDWLLALAVGLLAGCALAGDLVAAGLPADQAPLALLAFNLGIEAAQLAVLAALLAGIALLARRRPRASALATRIAAYGMGILAAFWCFERLAA